MINRIKNYNQPSGDGDDDDFELTEKDIQEIEELLADTKELKKVAARNVLRATEILDMNPTDQDVAKLLLGEAVVMMQVVHRIETFFGENESE